MSSGIAPIVATPGAVSPATDPRLSKLRQAASEFESLLLKQLLAAAKIGGNGSDEKASGYADMAVDALATSIERGGGLGLAHRIEQAVAHGIAPGTPDPHKGNGG
jgi:Rod binding domain-containing protein